EPALVKTKRLSSKPMSTDEAILQMELLGHDFFVFRSDDNEGTSVLYRRNDGDYGLITSQ
ncbi:ribosome-associated translation inhibitor RaiA, partial [bacterium]|nr:ribosome-associated translation inhibitor RaiA [bacterium]